MATGTRLFIDTGIPADTPEFELPAQALAHLRARRARVGDALRLFDGGGEEWRGELLALERRRAVVRVTGRLAHSVESPLRVTLVQGISKGDRMDFAVQKAVELGVHRILPAFTEHGVVNLDAERAARRAEHWRRVAVSACEQCGRNRVPEVAEPRPLDVIWPEIESLTGVVLDPTGDGRLADLPAAADFALIVGPEGGLSEREQRTAIERGCLRLALGPRILRTETAAIVALTALQIGHGDLAGGPR